MKRQMAYQVLVMLPTGELVTEADLSRIHVSRHAKQLVYLLMFVALVLLGSFDGPL